MTLVEADLNNAERDLDDLGKIVGGAPTINGTGQVPTRLGQSVKVLSKVISEIQTTLPAISYATESALLAVVPTVSTVAYAIDTQNFWKYIVGTGWVSQTLGHDTILNTLLDMFGSGINHGAFGKQGRILKADGTVVSTTLYQVTDFIAVGPDSIIRQPVGTFTNDDGSTSTAGLAFYDGKKTFLGYRHFTTSPAVSQYSVKETYPSAKFIRCCDLVSGGWELYVDNFINNTFVKNLAENLLSLYSARSGDINYASYTTDGYIAKATGLLVNNNTWQVTPFIPVGTKTVVKRNSGTISNDDTTAAALIAFFDIDKNYLGYRQFTSGVSSYTVGSEFPTARFVRASNFKTDTYNVNVIEPFSASNIDALNNRATALEAKDVLHDAASVKTDGNSQRISDLFKSLFRGDTYNYAIEFQAGLLSKANGTVSNLGTSTSWSFLDFTAVTYYTEILKVSSGESDTDNSGPGIVFFDEGKNYLGYYNWSGGVRESVTVKDLFPTARFIKVGILQSSVPTFDLRIITRFDNTVIKNLAENLLSLYSARSGDINYASYTTDGYIAKATGNYVNNTSWQVTPFIPVGTKSIVKKVSGSFSDDDSTSAATLAFFDKDRVFLGYRQFTSTITSYTVGSEFPTARFVRGSNLKTNTYELYVIDKFSASNIIALENQLVGGYVPDIPKENYKTNKILGFPDTYYENNMVSGYVTKASGAEVANTSWKRTGFIPVTSRSRVVRNGSVASGDTTAVAFIAFYDSAKAFLGYYQNTSTLEEVVVGDHYPTAAFIRISDTSTSTTHIEVKTKVLPSEVEGFNDVKSLVFTAFSTEIVDYQTLPTVVEGYITASSGTFVASSSWRTTEFIPVTEGSSFVFTGLGGSSAVVANISLWGESQNYLGAGLAVNSIFVSGVAYTVPATVGGVPVKYVRASAAQSYAKEFIGTKATLTSDTIPPELKASFLLPAEMYAINGEPVGIYLRGILPDPAFSIMSNLPGLYEKGGSYTPTSVGDKSVVITARGPDDKLLTLGTSVMKVLDTPVNPVSTRNIICIGDSLTAGIHGNTGSPLISGAYVNELSRRLNGTGAELLSGTDSPSALSLSNMVIRGTLGSSAVKHEGRPGWTTYQYLTEEVIGSVGNAFYNPGTDLFDLDYYLTQNSFDNGSISGGVDSTGSNLTIVLFLGWNDLALYSQSQSATHVSQLIDRIQATHPDTDIILLGLNPSADITIEGTTVALQRETFDSHVKKLGEAYRTLAASDPNVDFLQISHVFNPEVGCVTNTFAKSPRANSNTFTAAVDNTHPNLTGYAMIADAVFYKLISKYCQ